ncbi:hypothetical protein [Rhodococcus sp. SBT000017]|nr:hypothetical protein [Rhodococcus sp. SBT000017]
MALDHTTAAGTYRRSTMVAFDRPPSVTDKNGSEVNELRVRIA